MKKQENREANNQDSVVEDLTVNEDQAAEVKGGPVDHTIYVPIHVIAKR